MKKCEKGEKLKNSSKRPRAYWPPESREVNAKYDGSTIDMYQAGILLCKILSPKAKRLLSRSTNSLEYLYNNEDLQHPINELQSSIERLNKYISHCERNGCEIMGDAKNSLEEKKNKLQEWKQIKEIDVSDVLNVMKRDDECVNISSDLEELIRALLDRSPDARPVADETRKDRKYVKEFAWVKSSALEITDAELVAEISHRMTQSGKTTKVQWSHHTSRGIVLKKLENTIKGRLKFSDIETVSDSKLGASGLVISGICMPVIAKLSMEEKEKYHRQIVVKCDVRNVRTLFYLYHALNNLQRESLDLQENDSMYKNINHFNSHIMLKQSKHLDTHTHTNTGTMVHGKEIPQS